MLLPKAFAIVVFFVMLASGEEEKKMCPDLKFCLDKMDGKVTPDDMKGLMTIKNKSDLEKIPVDLLNTLKCILEKKGMLVDGKMDPEKLMGNKMMTGNIDDKDKFEKCIKKIPEIKEPEDVKKYLECVIEANSKE